MLCFFVDEDFSLLPISCGTVLALLICFLKLLLLDTDDPKLRDDEQSLMDWSDLLMAGVGRGEGQGVGRGLGISLMGDRHLP